MTQNRTVTALFGLKNYFLNLDSNLGGNASLGAGNYDHGELVAITATPENGYQFESWSDVDGNLSSPVRTIIGQVILKKITIRHPSHLL